MLCTGKITCQGLLYTMGEIILIFGNSQIRGKISKLERVVIGLHINMNEWTLFYNEQRIEQ